MDNGNIQTILIQIHSKKVCRALAYGQCAMYDCANSYVRDNFRAGHECQSTIINDDIENKAIIIA